MSDSDLISKHQIAELLPPRQEPIHVGPDVTIQQALDTLNSHNIHYLPVIELDTVKGTISNFYGSVSSVEIAAFIASQVKSNDQIDATSLNQILSSEKISEVIAYFKSDILLPMSSNLPLKLGVQALCNIAHLLPVTTQGVLTGVLSQTDVLNAVAKNIEGFLPSKTGKTLSELGLVKGIENIKKFHEDNKVSEILATFHDQKVSAVAIVDSSDKLIANFSASDVKILSQDLSKLFGSVGSFTNLNQLQVVTATPQSTINEVIETLADKKLHRVWVVDEQYRPVGVISLSNIMKLLLEK